MARTISQNGLNLIKKFEGCRLVAYADQGGIITIGYGHTGNIAPGFMITQEQAEEFLREDLEHTQAGIDAMVHVPLSQNQYDALCSFVFNIGRGHFKDSTCLDRLNKGSYSEAAAWMLPWHRVAGVENEGLLKRRMEERDLFLRPDNV